MATSHRPDSSKKLKKKHSKDEQSSLKDLAINRTSLGEEQSREGITESPMNMSGNNETKKTKRPKRSGVNESLDTSTFVIPTGIIDRDQSDDGPERSLEEVLKSSSETEKKPKRARIVVDDREEDEDEGVVRKKTKKVKSKEESEETLESLPASAKDQHQSQNISKKKKKRDKGLKRDVPPEEGCSLSNAANPDKDPTLSEQASKGLNYARSYVEQGPNSSLWKFNKAKQNWLMRHVFDSEQIPETHLDPVLVYLKSVQGGSRVALLKSCNDVLNPPPASIPEPQPSPDEKLASVTTENPPTKLKSALKKNPIKAQEKPDPTPDELEKARIKEMRARKLLEALQ